MISVTMYSRDDCHLCDEAEAYLTDLQSILPHELEIVDIDGNQELQKTYGSMVPVIAVGPYQLKAPFTQQEVEITLRAAIEREKSIEKIDKKIAAGELSVPVEITKADRFSYWISKHYMFVLNFLVLLYLGLPFLSPVMMAYGYSRPATTIYRVYSFVCHQLAYRSWFLFGDQIAYPRETAGIENLIPYGVATGLEEADEFDARQFIGNSEIGYKVALCERDVAIYGGILIFGLIFSITGRRMKPFPWYLWLLIGIVPIAGDGFSQLLSQPPLNILPYRESTPFLRSLTGFLFGFTTAWFGYPLVEESMAEIRQYYRQKFKRSQAQMESRVASDAIPPV